MFTYVPIYIYIYIHIYTNKPCTLDCTCMSHANSLPTRLSEPDPNLDRLNHARTYHASFRLAAS